MSDVKNFIDLVAQGNNNEAKDMLDELLSAKAFVSLDAKKQELASGLFGGVSEEVNQIDESYEVKPHHNDEYGNKEHNVHYKDKKIGSIMVNKKGNWSHYHDANGGGDDGHDSKNQALSSLKDDHNYHMKQKS